MFSWKGLVVAALFSATVTVLWFGEFTAFVSIPIFASFVVGAFCQAAKDVETRMDQMATMVQVRRDRRGRFSSAAEDGVLSSVVQDQ